MRRHNLILCVRRHVAMLDVSLPPNLMAEPDTPNRKKKKGPAPTPDSGRDTQTTRRLTVQELHARHGDSSDESDDDVATGA